MSPASLPDLLQDLDVGTVVPFTAAGSHDPVTVSKGAMEAFTQIVNVRSPRLGGEGQFPGATLSLALAHLLESAPGTPQATVYVTGHSLGGCLATMVALYLRAREWPTTAGPVVTGLSVTAGEPGIVVIINGSGFAQGSVVDFGPIPCEDFSVSSDTQIEAVVPDGVGIVNVRVTNIHGTSAASPASQFAYGGPEPLFVASINPCRGNRSDSVVITGSGFVSGCGVSFGDTAADPASVTFQSSSQVTAYPPEKVDGGTVNVTVTVGVITSPASPVGEFTYTI